MKSIYFLPHYDDEVFAIPKIRWDILNGRAPIFIYFMASPMRAKESTYFLDKLGVSKDSIIFLGEKLQVTDGELLNYLPRFYTELSSLFESNSNEIEIICPAYEGGHQDHDAISLLGRALSKKWNCNFLEVFLYHGYGMYGKLYRVSSHLHAENKKTYNYSLKDWLTLLKVPFVYKSQFSAMIGLWPFLILKSIYSPLVLRENLSDSLVNIGHDEVPMYERWGRMTEKQFLEKAKTFHEFASILKFKKT